MAAYPEMLAAPTALAVALGLADDAAGSGPDHDDKKLGNWSSLIGIITAIVGNILIALALNVQRYAHIRLRRQRAYNRARAKAVLKRAQNGDGAPVGGGGSYGTMADGLPSPSGNGDGDAASGNSRPSLLHRASSAASSNRDADGDGQVATYLKSPYWWLGQVLITVGEAGNFLAYGFAPASIVSPLGVVALIANCVFAPILFKERFRARDFWGVVIAVAGVVTVVLSAKTQETKLEPHDVWDAITTIEFEIFLAVTICLIILLMWASTKYGNRTILIDLGLVGLFGCYTVLATKGVSSMLSATFLRAFTTPVTYALLVVLLGTAIMQVRYVNKALQRFDSTQVIPIQFVMFTLCVITGSAVLYRDFERTTTEQAAKFIGGCLLTFFGVFLITSGRNRKEDEEVLLEAEGLEETIGLHEQSANQHTAPVGSSRSTASSRRSSRASRVSFADGVTKPLSVQLGSGFPSSRVPPAAAPRPPPEAVPLLKDPWDENDDGPAELPAMPSLSTDAVPTIAVTNGSDGLSTTPIQSSSMPALPTMPPEGPVTPRASMSGRPGSRHYPDLIISPSPLGSTVSAVVKDTLRRHVESPLAPKSSLSRLRSSIRASLFIPDDDDDFLQDDLHEEDENGQHEGHEHSALLAHDAPDGVVAADAGGSDGEPAARDGIRRRARSLSQTLGELFGRKKRKKGSVTDTEDEVEDNGGPDAV